MRRRILCEGPDDVAALREIGPRIFGAKRSVGPRPPNTPERLNDGKDLIEIIRVPGAKSQLIPKLVQSIKDRPPLTGPDDEGTFGRVGVVFDPDEKPVTDFLNELDTNIRTLAAWTFTCVKPGVWSALHPDGSAFELHCVAWSISNETPVRLLEKQSLERIVHEILRRTYPAAWVVIEPWLPALATYLDDVERGKQRSPPKAITSWKSLVHLWCALVQDDATVENVADQVCLARTRNAGSTSRQYLSPRI